MGLFIGALYDNKNLCRENRNTLQEDMTLIESLSLVEGFDSVDLQSMHRQNVQLFSSWFRGLKDV